MCRNPRRSRLHKEKDRLTVQEMRAKGFSAADGASAVTGTI
jgi:hypothetical protein